MKRNISKIIEKTEFLVQKKTGGWKGYNIYARHRIWSKFSCTSIKKPTMTTKLKTKIVEMALMEKDAEDHNTPLFHERMAKDGDYRSCCDDIARLLWDNDKRAEIIKELETICEFPSVNHLLQRILDMDLHKKEIETIERKKLPRPDREIK